MQSSIKSSLFSLLLILFSLSLSAQDMESKSSTKSRKEVELPPEVQALEKSIDANNPIETARSFERLAKTYKAKKKLKEAYFYYSKASEIYKKNSRKKDYLRVERLKAKLLEEQNLNRRAIQTYEKLSSESEDVMYKKLNSNDAKRLKNDNPEIQSQYTQSNIAILEEQNEVEEVADAYLEEAELSISSDESKKALTSLKKALDYTKDEPKKRTVKKKIAEVYTKEKQFEEALKVNEKLLKEAVVAHDTLTQIQQQQVLATNYRFLKREEEAITSLQKSLELSKAYGDLKGAKRCVEQLSKIYKKAGKEDRVVALYDDFVDDLDDLVYNDRSIVEDKIAYISEKKILQLEKERELKDELIERKNTFNYVLILALIVLVGFVVFVIKSFFSIKSMNKKIALQSLRREMNPHFIFNSLNSVNQFISENNELEANKYLTSYSSLMRDSMENSNKDFISVYDEIQIVEKYLSLEHLRFKNKFEYTLEIDPSIDKEGVFIPNMVLQPHIENAIWHGLRYIEGEGKLRLTFKIVNNRLLVVVEDNGIGIAESKKLKTQHQKKYQSRGIKNTEERVELLNDLYNLDISISIADCQAPDRGTQVIVDCPLIDNL